MKRFFRLLAVVVVLGALTPAYIPATFDSFGEVYVARGGEVHYRCHHCGRTVASHETPKAVKERCKKSPNHKHSFGSCGRW